MDDAMTDEDRKELIRNTCALESLTKTVQQLHIDLEAVKLDRQRDNESREADRVSVAVLAEKVDRISWVVYGTAAAIGVNTLAMVVELVVYIVAGKP